MVSNNKVLTVSYGTFSCTLEGFDDSFDTMKAIAEYFRDLAADDRYFGAEPPTPDADMLARIAEKEVERRVEARLDGDNIVLRTALPKTADLEEAATDEGHAETTQTPESAQIDVTAKNTPSVQEQATLPADETESATNVVEQDQTAETVPAAPEKELDGSDSANDAVDIASSIAQIEDEDTEKNDAAKADSEDDDANSISAKLARIRAVVGKPQEDAPAPQFSEDEHADEILDTLPGDTDLADILPDAPTDKPALQSAESAETPKNADDTIANVMEQLADTAADTAAPLPAPDLEDDEKTAALAEQTKDAEPAKDASDAATADDAVAQNIAELTETNTAETAEAELDEASDKATTGDEPAEQTPAKPKQAAISVSDKKPARPKLRARVIKMKRAEFEKAVADGALEEVADEDDTAADTAPQVNSSLNPTDEDELQRELAAVEAELAELDATEPASTPVADQPAEAQNPVEQDTRVRDELPGPPEAEMDRLISQTSNELEEPEGKQRRSAMGHLRAAVAAARADQKISPNQNTADEAKAYRSDLDEAVRPKRPVRRVIAKSDKRAAPAPLKLVAEQRVDLPEAETASPADAAKVRPARPVRPVRPAKVARAVQPDQAEDALEAAAAPNTAPAGAQDIQEFSDDGTFQEFAEEMGALELPDLLEAAAAYLAYVEGLDQFSRPQLMTKVRMVQQEQFSREEGLRSFGQLLRQGKIEKIAGGRFTISDRISFKPDTRAAG